jgi:hypothetical protein
VTDVAIKPLGAAGAGGRTEITLEGVPSPAALKATTRYWYISLGSVAVKSV